MSVDNPAAAEGLCLGQGTRHLIHRPLTWDHYLLDAPSVGEEHFVLAAEMPRDHSLFNDGSGHFHDAQVAAETVREVSEFIGHRYFGMPYERPGLYHRLNLDLTDVAAWRTRSGHSKMSTMMRVRPTKPVGPVPHGLDVHGEVDIDGAPCGVVSAHLVFLGSRESGRDVTLSRDSNDPVPLADPAEVGRCSTDNVVIGEPIHHTHGRITTMVVVRPDFLVPEAPGCGQVSGLLLLEALRQSALLISGRTFGLIPTRSTPSACRVRFVGSGRPHLPLRCSAVCGPLGRDPHGRPSVPITLDVTQRGRTVVEATITVVQDF